MSQVYFVCATPGSSGNFLVKLIRNLLGSPGGLTPPTFLQTPPTPMTRDFWFDNVEIGDNPVMHVPFRPDYQKLKDRFPGCKIIVMTHSLTECGTIALHLWEDFYKDAYEFGAEPFFREIIESHSHLFSSTTLTPDQMTKKEINTFIKIVSYQTLLEGFYSLTVPTDPDILEIQHKDFYYQTALTRSRLELFTDTTFTDPAITFHDAVSKSYLDIFFKNAALLA